MKKFDAEIEIDENRGVIWVHSKTTGHTLIRIGGISKENISLLMEGKLLDIAMQEREHK